MDDSFPRTQSANQGRSMLLEERVYIGLLDDIRLGNFTMGQRLPSETDLAEQYGCSRPVIRSALAKLRENGLIVSRQGSGSFVSSGHVESGVGFSSLDSIDDIAGYFAFRKVIESQTVELAAALAQPDDIATLRELVETMDRQADRGVATVVADFEFHEKIAKLSDNRFLYETLLMLKPHWMFIGKFVRSLGTSGYRVGKKHMANEHARIVQALANGDSKSARAAMIDHIDGSERRVFKGER